MTDKRIQTVQGTVDPDELGLILPHEHLFTDLRRPQALGYAQAEPEDVVRVIGPYLEQAYAAGVTVLIECSPVGTGRNVEVLQRLAQVTPIHIVAPTGVYREAFVPPALHGLSAEALAEMWVQELTQGIEGAQARAGFIKLAVSDEGITPLEVRNLQAAALASQHTGAVIASHTIGGALARREMDLLQEAGLDLARFIWVHAHAEPDTSLHLQAAQRGAYVEFDVVGAEWQSQDDLVDYVLALVEAGHADKILLSHDAGWYDPSQADGQPEGGIRGYTALVDEFLPALRSRGLLEDVLRLITVTNPARAFAFSV